MQLHSYLPPYVQIYSKYQRPKHHSYNDKAPNRNWRKLHDNGFGNNVLAVTVKEEGTVDTPSSALKMWLAEDASSGVKTQPTE